MTGTGGTAGRSADAPVPRRAAGGQDPAAARRPSITDVATQAGVSRATASRAVTGRGPVSPAVRARVLAAAKELNYVANATARSLKAQTSQTIGVLVSDLRNPFYAEMAAGAGAAARRAGYTMLLADGEGREETEAAAGEAFLSHRVAGVVTTPISGESTSYLLRHGIAVVHVDRTFSDSACDAVVVDNRGGSMRVTEHLIALGHWRIALLIDETDWTTGRDRRLGYLDALAAAGVPTDPDLVISSGWGVPQAVEAALALLSSTSPPTAVFAVNNVLAESVYRAADQLELLIPQQLSLVSFDDVPWMTMVRPRITAVSQDAGALGTVAVERLIERLRQRSGPPRTIVLPAELQQRESTAPPA